MALTKIRGSQIQDGAIGNSHIDASSPIHYSNLDLSNSIVASDLASNNTVHQDVLDSKLVALWDLVEGITVSAGSSKVVTSEIQGSATTDTATNDGATKGVFTSGTGLNGAGSQNYRLQVRDSVLKDPVQDGLGGSVYGELSHDGSDYTVTFKKSDDSNFAMGVAEVVSINSIADVNGSLGGKYFLLNSPSTEYYVWFNTGASADPAPAGKTAIPVAIAANADASAVAIAARGAITSVADFGAAGAGTEIIVTNQNAGVVTEPRDGSGLLESGFSFEVTAQGSPASVDIMFVEIYSLLDAPLKGFVTGTGFADVVGISGSHNHHDLYYSRTELESGQLDDRYYTETELENGQLDGRYFTESELTAGALDGRYYTESELGSTASGSAGASLIGFEANGNLGASTVQSALVELQGDIDNIASGGLDITQSLDDAYNDGSTIAVDNTDVLFQMADTKTFKVQDAAGSDDILAVAANAAGDTVAIKGKTDVTGDFGVVGATTLDGVTMDGALDQSNGAVTLNAGANAMDLDGGAITIDGATIAAAATGEFTVKDANLSAALSLSQSGVSGLVGDFAYNSQTDFDWTGRDIGTAGVTSLVGAVNVNREDLYEYVELLSTQGAAVGTAAGANLIGVDGIVSVVPTGKNLGEDATLQEMLEGIASSGGGSCKHFASEAAFIAAKQGGEYFNLNTQVYFEDTEREARVLTQSTNAVEGVDFDYLWSTARPLQGPVFAINAGVSIDTDAGVTIDGATGVDILSAANVSLQGIDVTEAGNTALTTTAQSIIGAINELDSEAGTLVTDLADTTDGSSGADIVGVTGITGVLPEGGTVGGDATLQAMLEGLAKSAGGIKTYADTAAFTASKAAGDYLPVDSMGYIKDIDRLVMVLVEGTQVVEGTDYDVMWDVNQPLAGAAFKVTSDVITLDTAGTATIASSAADVDIWGTTGVAIGGSTFDLTGNAESYVNVNGGNLVVSTNTTGGIIFDSAEATTFDSGSFMSFTAAEDNNIALNTSGTGQVQVESAVEIDLNAPLIDVHGDMTIEAGSQLNVDQINITSVDPSDFATITGQRTGIPFAGNLLSNPGFETGVGSDADDWTEGTFSGRSQAAKYYDNYSYSYNNASETGGVNVIATQAVTGLNVVSHIASLWFKGSAASAVEVVANGTTVELIPAGTVNTAWTRYEVDVTPGSADGNFVIQVNGIAADANTFYIDALQLEEGTGAATNYFSTYQSELIMRIGDEAEDKISFQSQAPNGGTVKELMSINNTTVTISGNLDVEGTTTTINSEELLVADNKVVLNDGQASGILDAELEVDRGSDANVAIRWNETTDSWELTNDGTTFGNIVTGGAGGALDLDAAYDGGSSVTVDNTNVVFTMDATKSFKLADSTDANKFAVTAGSGSDSVKIDTTGGVDIDANSSFTVTANTIDMSAEGVASLYSTSSNTQIYSATNQVSLFAQNASNGKIYAEAGSGDADAIKLVATNGGVDIDGATFDVDTTGSISLDSGSSANLTADTLPLTLSTVDTSGGLGDSGANIVINSIGGIDVDSTLAYTLDAPTIGMTGVLTQTGATQIIGAMDFDGAIDHDGASFASDVTGDFTVNGANVVLTGTTEADITAPVVDINGATSIDLDGAAINTTGVLTQTGNAQIVGDLDVDAAVVTIDTTGGISLDAASVSNFQVTGGNLDVRTVTSGNLNLGAANEVFIGGNSGVTVTAIGNAIFQSSTSGDVILSSAEDMTFNDQYLTAAIPLSETGVAGLVDYTATSIVGALNEIKVAASSANTLDEIYDGETGARVVTMDNGDVDFQVGDTYKFQISDSIGAGILSAKALATGDVVSVGGSFDVTGGTTGFGLSGTGVDSFKVLTAGGVDIDASSTFTVDAQALSLDALEASNFTVDAVDADQSAGNALTISTVASGSGTAGSVSIASGKDLLITTGGNINGVATGEVVFSSGTNENATLRSVGTGKTVIESAETVEISGGAFDVNAGSGKNVTIDTSGAGDVLITSSNAVQVAAAAASSINVTGADLTIGTITSGELYFDDARTSAIPFSDVATATLPGTATSVLGAITDAYNNKGTEVTFGYQEVVATGTDVTNDYVVLTLDEFPTTGTFPMSPAALRSAAASVHAGIFLNGLRLSDTEWNYTYDGGSGEKRITLDGSDNITLVAGDKLMVEAKKITDVTA